MALLVPFSIPSSPHHSFLLLQRRPHRRQQHSHFLIKSNSSSSSSSFSSSVVTEQEDSPPLPPSETDDDGLVSINSEDPQFRGCKSCGREEIERGCNGEGRIQGGIATVPGFGWWPIKAFRPCPGFVASGGRYRRRGQSMDEVASGRGRGVSLENTAKAKSSKGRQGPGRLKG